MRSGLDSDSCHTAVCVTAEEAKRLGDIRDGLKPEQTDHYVA